MENPIIIVLLESVRGISATRMGNLGRYFPLSTHFPLESAVAKLFVMSKSVDCQCQAFQLAIEVLGRPWTALILTLLQAGARRFNEIGEAAPGLGTKVLSVRLKDLEARGLVQRNVESGPPIRVSYELTQKGRAFGEVAQAVERWGHELAREASASPRARKARSRPAALHR